MKEYREYEEDNRTIHLLEGDIFLDFEVQSNDTDQVHAFITTDQDRWEDLNILIIARLCFVNSVQVVTLFLLTLFRLWPQGKIPFTFHQTLRDVPYRYDYPYYPLLKQILTQGEVYPGGHPRTRGRQLSAV